MVCAMPQVDGSAKAMPSADAAKTTSRLSRFGRHRSVQARRSDEDICAERMASMEEDAEQNVNTCCPDGDQVCVLVDDFLCMTTAHFAQEHPTAADDLHLDERCQ